MADEAIKGEIEGNDRARLKELGGWETLEMVEKYAHLNAGHLAEYANNVTFGARNNNATVQGGVVA